MLFVQFGDFACHTHLPLFAKDFTELLEGLDQPSGGLVEDNAAGLVFECFQPCLPSLLLWQESFEAEFVAGESAAHEGWNECGGSRKGLHLYALFHALAHQEESRVADAGCACIADECGCLSSFKASDHLLHGFVFVELVVGEQFPVDVVMLQQHAGGAGVFCQYEISLFQHSHRPEGHIFEISHRCRHNVEHSHGSFFLCAKVGTKVKSEK